MQRQAFIVNNHIKEFIKSNLKTIASLSFLNDDIIQIVDTVSPVRERAYLMCLSSELSNTNENAVELLALVIEMQIIAAYLKDDILDSNSVRSHQQTVNSKYDIKRAAIYSDLFLNSSYIALEKVRQLIPEAHYKEVILKITESYQYISLGQIETVCFGYTDSNIISAIRLLYERLVGIAFGNYCSLLIYQDDILKEQLFLFGKNIGMALQIKNDISDFIIDPSISGISPYQDLLQGQPNIVVAYLLEYKNNFSQNETQLLDNLLFHKYESEKIIEDDEDTILNMLEKSNAIGNALLLYNKLLNNCLEHLVFIQNARVREKYVNFVKILIFE